MKSVAFYTLGCKLNFSESSSIAMQLEKEGFKAEKFEQGADFYVINTCSVTENADRKCRKVVKEALRFNPDASVVIIGCYAQLKPQEISEIPGVDLVLGASEKFNLAMHLKDLAKGSGGGVYNSPIKETNIFVPAFSGEDRTRTFLKVQDGCDYFCTFCTIPLARGKSRSHTIAETMKTARQVALTGTREVVLTGVNIGDFGVLHGESFYDLIRELDGLEGVDRFRISSIEPNLLEDRIIDFVAQSKRFAPHFHIPLQSGSDELLIRMRRKYERSLYTNRVERIRGTMPNAAIGVDVIVGFPGETEAHFEETYNYLRDLDISYLHVFPYSERANTTARKLSGSVPLAVRHERSRRLRILSDKKKRAFYQTQVGRTAQVLFEAEESEGKMHGFTENYVRLETDYDPLLINEIAEVKIGPIQQGSTLTCSAEMDYVFAAHSTALID
ncbi:MAG: tRNA (N(6)-L-threonylcarbamoyladenosine(37)-C(2))-methylthiotransferase MtaB [Flavobacteriales bacterium]|nr:tRNA (N(6)-L-threonylcarbamoyladenosine(37)-C(2))-methylthiotransferase MtaB [Flavobacteriales bacterium]